MSSTPADGEIKKHTQKKKSPTCACADRVTFFCFLNKTLVNLNRFKPRNFHQHIYLRSLCSYILIRVTINDYKYKYLNLPSFFK